MKEDEIFNTLFSAAEANVNGWSAQLVSAVTYKNDIISFGFNRMKTHPFQKRFAKNIDAIYLHAETDAIKNALRYLSLDELRHCSIYVCRAKRAGRGECYIPGLAKPCSGCMKAIVQFGFKKLSYSEDQKYKFTCM